MKLPKWLGGQEKPAPTQQVNPIDIPVDHEDSMVLHGKEAEEALQEPTEEMPNPLGSFLKLHHVTVARTESGDSALLTAPTGGVQQRYRAAKQSRAQQVR